jgi:hypothetical protein
MPPPRPIYRGQGNQPYPTNRPDGPEQRGQTNPYDVNGAPGTIAVQAALNEIVGAGEALGGHRAVYVASDGMAYYGNPDATSRLVAGITTGAASLGADVTIQTFGEIEEASWAWNDDGPVWLAANGQLTQTLPATGYLFQVGQPMGPTKLRIEPQLVAQLS